MRRNVPGKLIRPGYLALVLVAGILSSAGGAAARPASPGGSQPSASAVTVLSETFESWPPPGWVLSADPQTGGVWDSSSHPAGCSSGSSYPYPNNTGGPGLCADANSDCNGDGMDTTMVPPSFSLASSSYVSAQLQFKSDFFCAASLDEGWVDITTDNGAIWTNLLYFDHQSVRGPNTQTIDLTPFLGHSDVRLAFEYSSPGWDWYWQVDDVVVTAVQQVTCSLDCSATGPASASVGTPVNFSATATPSAGCTGTPAFSWSFGDGQSSTQQNPSHTYAAEGSYPWTMTVSVNGQTCSKNGTIAISAGPPVLTAGASADRTSGTAPLAVAFTGSASGGTGTGYSYNWNFGDGSAHSSTQSPVHTYSAAGTFRVTLAVTDSGSHTATDTHLAITVTSPVAPPVITLIRKAAPPFKLVVIGSNLQNGIEVYIDGAEWNSVTWKNVTKVQLTGAIKAAVPKGNTKTFRFVNPDGGEATMSWSW